MKKILLLVSLITILISCSHKSNYKLEGTVEQINLDGKKIYLQKFISTGTEVSDTAIIKDGKFKFKGTQGNPAVYFIFMDKDIGGEMAEGSPILIQPGDLTVRIVNDLLEIGGNEPNQAYQSMKNSERTLSKNLMDIQNKYNAAIIDDIMTPEMEKALTAESKENLTKMRKISVQYIIDNMNNPLGKEVFLIRAKILTDEQLDIALSKADKEFKSLPEVIGIQKIREKQN